MAPQRHLLCDTFMMAMGRVGDSGGLQERASSLGMWQAWVSSRGEGEGP